MIARAHGAAVHPQAAVLRAHTEVARTRAAAHWAHTMTFRTRTVTFRTPFLPTSHPKKQVATRLHTLIAGRTT